MPTAQDWADGFLAQARADLVAAKELTGTVPSTFAMLLQMTFEKMAKAALLRSGAIHVDWARRSHRAASRMTQMMRRQRGLLESIGGPWPWQGILDIVDALEQAHPAVTALGPHLEYPWEGSHGAVCWPEEHLQVARKLGESRRAAEVLKFASLVDRHFDEIFPR